MRRQKDRANLFAVSGDEDGRRAAQEKLNILTRKYKEFSDAAGLDTHKERMSVSGFRRVKTKAELKQNRLTNASGQPIIKATRNALSGAPDSITQVTGKRGGIERNYYNSEGKLFKQICNNDHGHPKQHPFGKHGEHTHDYVYSAEGKLIGRPLRNLTDEEGKENEDIL